MVPAGTRRSDADMLLVELVKRRNDGEPVVSLGKSRRGYGPSGPWAVTIDEVPNPDDLALTCSIDAELVQDARTDDLIFSVPQLIAELSAVLPLLPGDVIFTGDPAGVGMAREPPRSLQPGQVITSWIEGVGTIRNRCTAI